MNTQGRVHNKVALVTGGADGIGKSIASLLHAEGAFVFVADINKDLGEKTAQEVGGSFIMLDVSSEDSWKSAVDTIAKEKGRLDILVNNAGIIGKGAQDPEHVSLADWRLIHAINLAHERKRWIDREYVFSFRSRRCAWCFGICIFESSSSKSQQVSRTLLCTAGISYPLQLSTSCIGDDCYVETDARYRRRFYKKSRKV